jgi:hypothetical protein
MIRAQRFLSKPNLGVEVEALLVDGQHLQDAGSVAIGTIDKDL